MSACYLPGRKLRQITVVRQVVSVRLEIALHGLLGFSILCFSYTDSSCAIDLAFRLLSQKILARSLTAQFLTRHVVSEPWDMGSALPPCIRECMHLYCF